MIDLATQRYALAALAAAALFGASTPLAKLLQADITPGLLAGLLYFGSGGSGVCRTRRSPSFTSASPAPLPK